jgi:hypothetical protein
VTLAAIEALARIFVPSPAATSTVTRPSRAHAVTDAASSPLTAVSCRARNRAMVE